MIPHYLKTQNNRLFLIVFTFFILNLSFYFANLNLPQSNQNFIQVFLAAIFLGFLKSFFLIFLTLPSPIQQKKSLIVVACIMLISTQFWASFLAVEAFQTSSYPLYPILWVSLSTFAFLSTVFLTFQNQLIRPTFFSLLAYLLFALFLDRRPEFIVSQNIIFIWIQVIMAYVLVITESLQLSKIAYSYLNPSKDKK